MSSTLSQMGNYELRSVLARTGTSTVYDAWDSNVSRRVAIKAIRLYAAEDAEAREALLRFKRGVQAAGKLAHPNIINIYNYGETDEYAYIVMEFIDGPTLKQVLDGGKRFALADICRIVGSLLEGLQYSHDNGVVHRDIKPANIMFTRDDRVKITDFGIARLDDVTLTQTRMVIGTPAYMPPEQFIGEDVDWRADIYAVGVILYQMLTGTRPYDGNVATIMNKVLHAPTPRLSGVTPAITPALEQIITRAMAKKREHRYRSAAEFNAVLQAVLQQPSRVDPPGQMSGTVAGTMRNAARSGAQEEVRGEALEDALDDGRPLPLPRLQVPPRPPTAQRRAASGNLPLLLGLTLLLAGAAAFGLRVAGVTWPVTTVAPPVESPTATPPDPLPAPRLDNVPSPRIPDFVPHSSTTRPDDAAPTPSPDAAQAERNLQAEADSAPPATAKPVPPVATPLPPPPSTSAPPIAAPVPPPPASEPASQAGPEPRQTPPGPSLTSHLPSSAAEPPSLPSNRAGPALPPPAPRTREPSHRVTRPAPPPPPQPLPLPADPAVSMPVPVTSTSAVGLVCQSATADTAREVGLDVPRGMIVLGVTAGSAAATAGIRSGDILLSVNGIEMRDLSGLRSMAARLPPGQVIPVQIFRQGAVRTVPLRLDALR